MAVATTLATRVVQEENRIDCIDDELCMFLTILLLAECT
ncbi:WSSV288 [White spot syndrome virus]|uniref:WSSV151 n=1 Tax=White spot syndrome virus TaxID=342409 RepID=A0A2I6SC06_9VIRU|nr:WSSV288 [White spot syndrome virus]AYV99457.1 WSSV151 [White spot syndrome virus]